MLVFLEAVQLKFSQSFSNEDIQEKRNCRGYHIQNASPGNQYPLKKQYLLDIYSHRPQNTEDF